MFQLLVSNNEWVEPRGSMIATRFFEYTDDDIKENYGPDDFLTGSEIKCMPALFVNETDSSNEQVAHIGYITKIIKSQKKIEFEFYFLNDIPGIANSVLENIAQQLNIDSFEFKRTHWAIKDINLYRTLLKYEISNRLSPKVFEYQNIQTDNQLVSVMMPFEAAFDEVHKEITDNITEKFEKKCMRVDNMWENDRIVQDIVNLISRSKIVIADCTKRNPNVFYEIGIAHSIGKDVILITQNDDDIPFDLRHLRYVTYLNNKEGIQVLIKNLSPRLKTLLN